MNIKIDDSWLPYIGGEFEKPYFAKLANFVKSEYSSAPIFPVEANIFRALNSCSPEDVKVVIIGQDPYHAFGQANGLCFSVADGVVKPPSLVNIFKEVERDLGIPIPASGNLERWATQGVLMLNSVLTVREGLAASHQGRGWEEFTSAVVASIARQRQGVVYMLWGSYAQRKGAMIDPNDNCILKSVHPSPLSAYRGFVGCGHFSAANRYLESTGKTPIVW